MEKDESFEKGVFDLLGLEDIKKRPDILSLLRFDVTPHMVMEPRFHARAEDLRKLREMSGCVFYIEMESTPPKLMLMKLGKSDVMITVGSIEEIPQEYIDRAIQTPPLPPIHKMGAITKEIEAWLKAELGIA